MENVSNIHYDTWDRNPPNSYALSGKIMLSAIVILFAVVVVMVVLHIYARWYLLRVRRRYIHRRRQRTTQIVFYVDPNNSAIPARGLDAPVLDSLPVFTYSSRTHPDALECAVCLSEFEENEKGRELPTCHHSFHIDCIDMWFHSHATCPICRTPVEPENKIPQNYQTDSMVSPGSREPGSSEPGSSSGLSERRKGLDLVGVRIEVPRRSEFEDESRLSSPASQDYRSPGSRLLSLRRILSMNRRTPAVSPSAGIGTSRGYVGAESDVELGRGESTRGQTRAQTPR